MQITKEQLELHRKWLRKCPDGVRLDVRLADLRGADLRGADLRGADLREANLRGADLSGSDLWGADIRGTKLNKANLSNVIGLNIASDAADRLKAVAVAALESESSLSMVKWHTGGSTHCIAGWAIHLAGGAGELLERMMGEEIAGLMLLGIEAHSHFFDDETTARKWLQSLLN